MKKSKTYFICQNCGYKTPKWIGRCSECGSWNSFLEETDVKKNNNKLVEKIELKKLVEVKGVEVERYSSGIKEFDQVLGGGVVKGGVVLIGGEPGIGKSTIMLQISYYIGSNGKKVFYFSGEESLPQLRMRGERLNLTEGDVYFSATNSFEAIYEILRREQPDVAIIDSIQTIYSDELNSAAGTVSQVKFVTHKLVEVAKKNGTSIFIIGQVTKDGAIAGPKVLEHLVDTVLYFEGDYDRGLRILRAVKNRFGSTNEIGIFEMSEYGLREYTNRTLVNDNLKASGRAITVVMEGSRAFLVEIQALVSHTYFNYPRRNVTGFDMNRLNMLLAILEKKCGFNLSSCDVYLNVVGGLRITEPSVDLAVCAAVISSFKDIPFEQDIIFLGEVGLTGEIRTPFSMNLRLKEAERYGFKKIVTKMNDISEFSVEVISINNINELINYI
ncbi:DNA repair protein RadA [Deferribacter abyssi]|uniref:DNA repair protein RadA n=1 Tax=Deferribacter abyssi TaxID=213806 RepID=UPI003C26302D